MNKPLKFSVWFSVIIAAVFVVAWLWIRESSEPGPYDLEPVSIVRNGNGASPVPSEVEGWQTYRNEKYGFEIKYPLNYQISSRINTAIGPVIESDYGRFDFREVSDDYSKQILSANAKSVIINGYNAKKLPVSGNLDGGLDYEVMFVTKSGSYLVILFTTKRAGYESKVDEFDQILSTFKFVESANILGWKTYRNEKYRFEFEYPLDRNLVREGEDRRIIFREGDGLARIIIEAVDNPRLESVLSYGLKNYKLASDPQILEFESLINGNPAISFEHPEISGITYYITWSGHEGRIFVIFLDLGKDTNQHIISSLKFNDFWPNPLHV